MENSTPWYFFFRTNEPRRRIVAASNSKSGSVSDEIASGATDFKIEGR